MAQNVQHIDGSLYEFVGIGIEVHGGVDAGFEDLLRGWAKMKAAAAGTHSSADDSVVQMRRDVLAAQILQQWRWVLSAALLVASVKHIRRGIEDAHLAQGGVGRDDGDTNWAVRALRAAHLPSSRRAMGVTGGAWRVA